MIVNCCLLSCEDWLHVIRKMVCMLATCKNKRQETELVSITVSVEDFWKCCSYVDDCTGWHLTTVSWQHCLE